MRIKIITFFMSFIFITSCFSGVNGKDTPINKIEMDETFNHFLEKNTSMEPSFNETQDINKNLLINESSNDILEWGTCDNVEANHEEIKRACYENNPDRDIVGNKSFTTIINNNSKTTVKNPIEFENSLDDITKNFSDETNEFLFNPTFSLEQKGIFQIENVNFPNSGIISSILGKVISILDSFTYTVYTKSENVIKYTKGLTFWNAHKIDIDNNANTGTSGNDISIDADIKVKLNIKEKTITFGAELNFESLSQPNEKLPLEMLAFFRIPDSKGGKNDHIIVIGQSLMKQQIPKKVTISFLINTKGEFIVDLSTSQANSGISLIAGVGIRTIDINGNIDVRDLTSLETIFNIAPQQFQFKIDSNKFKFEPIRLTITSNVDVILAARLVGEKFGIQMLIKELSQQSEILFSGEDGILDFGSYKTIDATVLQAAGDFKNTLLVETSYISYDTCLELSCDSGYLTINGQEILQFSDYSILSLHSGDDTFIESYLKIINSKSPGIIYYPPDDEDQVILNDYISDVCKGNSVKGNYISIIIMDMPDDIHLRWKEDFNYVSFTMDKPLGPFDIVFVNLSKDFPGVPNIGNFVAAELDAWANIRFFNMPLENVTVNLLDQQIYVNLLEDLSFFFYVSGIFEDEPFNITGLISEIPKGEIDITYNPWWIFYEADGNIDVLAAVLNYKGLTASIGLLEIPKEIFVGWSIDKTNINIYLTEPIKMVVFNAKFNYTFTMKGRFPPQQGTEQDVEIFITFVGIQLVDINWGEGIDYTGVATSGSWISFIIKKDYPSKPSLPGYGLSLDAALGKKTEDNPLGIKYFAARGRFKTPTKIRYTPENEGITTIEIKSVTTTNDVTINAELKFVDKNTIAICDIFLKTLPRDILITIENEDSTSKTRKYFSYEADSSSEIDFKVFFGDPSLFNRLLPINGVFLYNKNKKFAIQACLKMTIPKEFWFEFTHCKEKKEFKIIGGSSTLILKKPIMVMAEIDLKIGNKYLRDTGIVGSLSNIPTYFMLEASYKKDDEDISMVLNYSANEPIDEIIAGLICPDEHGVRDWGAFVKITDIPTRIDIVIKKGKGFPFFEILTDRPDMDIIATLDLTRFKDVIEIPYITKLPYLEFKLIDIPAGGIMTMQKVIWTYPYGFKFEPLDNGFGLTAKGKENVVVGELFMNFTIGWDISLQLADEKHIIDEDKKYQSLWYFFDVEFSGEVKEFLVSIRNWHSIKFEMDALELDIDLRGISSGPSKTFFYMRWNVEFTLKVYMWREFHYHCKYYIVRGGRVHFWFLFEIYRDDRLPGYMVNLNQELTLDIYRWDNWWQKVRLKVCCGRIGCIYVDLMWPKPVLVYEDTEEFGAFYGKSHWILMPKRLMKSLGVVGQLVDKIDRRIDITDLYIIGRNAGWFKSQIHAGWKRDLRCNGWCKP